MTGPDLTIIYYTANVLKESFAEKVRKQLLKASQGLPIISVSRKPLDFGDNIVEVAKESGVINIYKAILLGAKKAKTDYIALAEDDALYPEDHFNRFLPPEDIFAYNLTRWNIYTWSNPPFFSIKFRRILATLIAPRKLLVEAIEERFAKYSDTSKIPLKWMSEPGRAFYEQKLGVTPRKVMDFYTYSPVIVFSHPDAIGYELQGKHKRANVIRALELPYWGTAQQVMKEYYDSCIINN